MRHIPIAAALCLATPAWADVEVTFRDGAPKDRFTITNIGSCATGEVILRIDLITAPAGVIFDTAEGGPGVEVFQPFELVTGAERVSFVSEVADGANWVTLVLSDLDPREEVAFTIDIDDVSSVREITVSGSEIAGAFAVIDTGEDLLEAAFDETGRAVVTYGDCAGS